MASPVAALPARLAQNVVLRVGVYYVLLLGVAALVWDRLPSAEALGEGSLDALLVPGAARATRATDTLPLDVVLLAMTGAVLLAIPVAWVYTLTRAKRGYQQSMVQALVILPIVVAGIVVLVKHSLALAFSLAGILAAVRFRNTLEDSKDAVHVFLATGLGLAAAVDLRVAMALSIMFNVVTLLLWRTDFGRSPALEGRAAERRLQRAMEQLSRTGTFVARMDDEVFRDMTPEQLQAVADRAWRRARRNSPEPPDPEGRREALLRVRTRDVRGSRLVVEPLLGEHLKRWRYGGVVHEKEGLEVVEYAVLLRKSTPPDELLSVLLEQGSPHVISAELG